MTRAVTRGRQNRCEAGESEVGTRSTIASMALTATLYRFQMELSDVDRGVYEHLDVRVAQHPSESARFMLARLLAYALCYEPEIAFAKGGVSSSDEPPVFIRDAHGKYLLWVEIGNPNAERLHKASKASTRVALFTTERVEAIVDAHRSQAIHQRETIAVWSIDPRLIASLEPIIEKSNRWEVVSNGGVLYVTAAGRMFDGSVTVGALG